MNIFQIVRKFLYLVINEKSLKFSCSFIWYAIPIKSITNFEMFQIHKENARDFFSMGFPNCNAMLTEKNGQQ